MSNRNGRNIFFVDDEERVTLAISETLEQFNFKVICFASAADCLEHLNGEKCDLLITDLRMPDMDGLDLLGRAKLLAPLVPVMIITGYGDIATAVECVKAGAVDFIEKPLDKKDFVEKVKSILHKNANHIGDHVREPLTESEKRVLKQVIDGKTNKEIAELFNRSRRTIEVHRARVMRKLDVDNVIDLVKRSAAMGLIEF